MGMILPCTYSFVGNSLDGGKPPYTIKRPGIIYCSQQKTNTQFLEGILANAPPQTMVMGETFQKIILGFRLKADHPWQNKKTRLS